MKLEDMQEYVCVCVLQSSKVIKFFGTWVDFLWFIAKSPFMEKLWNHDHQREWIIFWIEYVHSAIFPAVVESIHNLKVNVQ